MTVRPGRLGSMGILLALLVLGTAPALADIGDDSGSWMSIDLSSDYAPGTEVNAARSRFCFTSSGGQNPVAPPGCNLFVKANRPDVCAGPGWCLDPCSGIHSSDGIKGCVDFLYAAPKHSIDAGDDLAGGFRIDDLFIDWAPGRGFYSNFTYDVQLGWLDQQNVFTPVPTDAPASPEGWARHRGNMSAVDQAFWIYYTRPDDIPLAGLNFAELLARANWYRSIYRGGFSDSDGDGVIGLLDWCPATPSGVEVAFTGCSQEEFCRTLPVSTTAERRECNKADWRNDEPRMRISERDCRVNNNGTRNRDDDVCESTGTP